MDLNTPQQIENLCNCSSKLFLISTGPFRDTDGACSVITLPTKVMKADQLSGLEHLVHD